MECFATNMHFDNPNHAGANAIVASAQARGIPVVSAKQMLDWLDGRNSSSYQNITWDGTALSFTINVGAGANNLKGMLPVLGSVGKLVQLTRDNTSVSFTKEIIKGIEYAFYPAMPAVISQLMGLITLLPSSPKLQQHLMLMARLPLPGLPMNRLIQGLIMDLLLIRLT